jgi:hypothetical protein
MSNHILACAIALFSVAALPGQAFGVTPDPGGVPVAEVESSKYPGILNLRGVPLASVDWSFAPFSDLGA